MIDFLKSEFEKYLNIIIQEYYSSDDVLSKSIKYALEGRGKRVRPLLCMLSCISCGGDVMCAMPAALAIEMAHTYSLVHDDLPSMDNDSLRRGRPTVHVIFGEANAILCGDALLTDAFSVLFSFDILVKSANHSNRLTQMQILNLIKELSFALGSKGMVMGQSLDIQYTGQDNILVDIKTLDNLHLHKTGALLSASCAMGAICAGANDVVVNIFKEFGKLVGLAFQITDDILDNKEGIGKTANKDLKQKKLTYLKFMNEEEAQKQAKVYTQKALSLIENMEGNENEILKQFVISLLERKY